MNERIKELAEQCVGDRPYNNSFDYEKFAKLIVKECIGIIRPYEDDDHYIEKDVRKHFGIEPETFFGVGE